MQDILAHLALQPVEHYTMTHEAIHEPKTEATHQEQLDIDTSERTGKLGELLNNRDKVKDGDLGARWLEEYTGERRELTDEENNRIRNKVGPLMYRGRVTGVH